MIASASNPPARTAARPAHRRRPAGLERVWARSLRLRVAGTTVLLAGVVVLVVGLFLNNRVADGILEAKQNFAEAQARAGINNITSQLQVFDSTDVNGVRRVLDQLNATSGSASAGAFFTSVRADAALQQRLGPQPPIPPELVQTVTGGAFAMQYAPVTVASGTQVPGLIVGGLVSTRAASLQLYYLFPLVSERDTIALVQRTVALAGIGLVVLVAVIALVVTRQVVRPVRVAARTAVRLSAGDLDQRIDVRGEDELALLGRSFNQMADSLQRQISALEQLSELQRRFTSDVSHELRTPLTTVRMAAEVLDAQRAGLSPDLARSVVLLNTELDRFENLLADLLEISRYDAGQAVLDLEPTDIGAVVRKVAQASAPIADRNGVDVDVTYPPSPITADADPRRLERIVRNLIGNAIDHSEGEPVEVVVGGDGEAVSILVRDHGVGLRDGEAEHVFDRFWRGDPSRSRLTGGTGLGLAISLEDARLHGGRLDAAGRPGEGAAFLLTLPLRAGAALTHAPVPMPFGADSVQPAEAVPV
jgi:two-component system, OmpR family, sensor histidine kinase MtrB